MAGKAKRSQIPKKGRLIDNQTARKLGLKEQSNSPHYSAGTQAGPNQRAGDNLWRMLRDDTSSRW